MRDELQDARPDQVVSINTEGKISVKDAVVDKNAESLTEAADLYLGNLDVAGNSSRSLDVSTEVLKLELNGNQSFAPLFSSRENDLSLKSLSSKKIIANLEKYNFIKKSGSSENTFTLRRDLLILYADIFREREDLDIAIEEIKKHVELDDRTCDYSDKKLERLNSAYQKITKALEKEGIEDLSLTFSLIDLGIIPIDEDVRWSNPTIDLNRLIELEGLKDKPKAISAIIEVINEMKVYSFTAILNGSDDDVIIAKSLSEIENLQSLELKTLPYEPNISGNDIVEILKTLNFSKLNYFSLSYSTEMRHGTPNKERINMNEILLLLPEELSYLFLEGALVDDEKALRALAFMDTKKFGFVNCELSPGVIDALVFQYGKEGIKKFTNLNFKNSRFNKEPKNRAHEVTQKLVLALYNDTPNASYDIKLPFGDLEQTREMLEKMLEIMYPEEDLYSTIIICYSLEKTGDMKEDLNTEYELVSWLSEKFPKVQIALFDTSYPIDAKEKLKELQERVDSYADFPDYD